MTTLNLKQIEEILGSPDAQRKRDSMTRRIDYYTGAQAITRNQRQNPDGSSRVATVHNKIREMVDRLTGFSLADGVKISHSGLDADLSSDKEGQTGLDIYQEIKAGNDLETVDVEHFRECLVSNFAVEIHTTIEKDGAIELVITQTPSHEWTLIYNESNELFVGIRQTLIPACSYWRGEYQAETVRVVEVYDSEEISFYKDTKYKRAARTAYKQRVSLEAAGDSVIHNYGRPPLVVFSTTRDRVNYISDSMTGLQDHLNDLLSGNGNDVKRTSDGMLALKGYEPSAENERVVEKAKESGVIILAADGSIENITFGSSVDRVRYQVDETRQSLFEEGDVPDIERIVGATGSTSGIALKLKSTPMKHRADMMLKYFKNGIRDRIDLINHVLGVLGSPLIEDYKITIEPRLILNDVEVWQAIRQLDNLVSTKTQLSLIPGIDDPSGEFGLLQEQQGVSDGAEDPARAAVALDRAVQISATALEPVMDSMIQQVGDAALGSMIKNGSIDDLIKLRQNAGSEEPNA